MLHAISPNAPAPIIFVSCSLSNRTPPRKNTPTYLPFHPHQTENNKKSLINPLCSPLLTSIVFSTVFLLFEDEMILLVVVAVLWGITNALMKKYVKGIEKVEQKGFLANLLNEFLFIVYNWKYLLSFGTNQLGSLLYYYSLGQYDLSLAGPMTNAMTLAFTYISDKFLFESQQNKFEKMGLALICVGVLICFYDKM